MYLYKYRSFNINNLKALRENEIWFSRGIKFNDPFDCSLDVPLTLLSPQTMKEFILANPAKNPMLELAKTNNDLLNSLVHTQVRRAIQMMRNNELDKHALAPIVDYVSQKLVRSLICCFSKSSTNQLLWSHYSDSHRGFCIRFKKEVLLNDVEPNEHGDVEYIDQPVNILGSYFSEEDPVKDIIFCKSDVWSYEEEYRLTHKDLAENDTDDFRISKYSADAIDCIILGINSSESDLNLLKSVLSGRDIIYKKIKRSMYDYSLTVDVENL